MCIDELVPYIKYVANNNDCYLLVAINLKDLAKSSGEVLFYVALIGITLPSVSIFICMSDISAALADFAAQI